MLQRINFDLDKSTVREDAKSALDKNVQILNAYPDARIEIQGHCDERGTTEYNLALGQRRAASARSYLVAKGISANRISTKSYGEERPLATGSDEYAWGQNRRDEFIVVSGGDQYLKSSSQ